MSKNYEQEGRIIHAWELDKKEKIIQDKTEKIIHAWERDKKVIHAWEDDQLNAEKPQESKPAPKQHNFRSERQQIRESRSERAANQTAHSSREDRTETATPQKHTREPRKDGTENSTPKKHVRESRKDRTETATSQKHVRESRKDRTETATSQKHVREPRKDRTDTATSQKHAREPRKDRTETATSQKQDNSVAPHEGRSSRNTKAAEDVKKSAKKEKKPYMGDHDYYRGVEESPEAVELPDIDIMDTSISWADL